MVHEMESKVDVAVLIGIRKLAHDCKMISSSFDDLCPSEAGIKIHHERVEYVEQNGEHLIETAYSRRGSHR